MLCTPLEAKFVNRKEQGGSSRGGTVTHWLPERFAQIYSVGHRPGF